MRQDHKRLEGLMLFSEVATHLSFTLAAERLGISRGYLSERVKRLERELGVPLLVRTTRNVRLTEEGERTRRRMDDIRRTLLDLERHLDPEPERLAGPIRLTAPKLFTERYLLDICHAFESRHPAVRFVIDCSYTSHDLTLANFDLAFRATRTPPENMVARPLLHYRHCYCASPDYLEAHGRPETPADLARHRCLPWLGLDRWDFASGDIEVQGPLTLNDHELLKRECLKGRGIVCVAEYLVDRELRDGLLERVLVEETVGEQTIHVIHPPAVQQSERLRAFLQFAWSSFI
ncbi:HTH-type transcriptional regulator DmlR [Halomonas sp. THAF5a]|uniref:LysR family transcriptional regulator n=1 Tax=Halomonas sp. THAF5a TaxID=2587844 RepID=UPI001267E94C|nr:LysR family transcriptional regulator [Halomonas sp. THAF5a]QFU01056.1 HTH-type transcriptional regulator DmlR [Halomonas sp. THAF5a]